MNVRYHATVIGAGLVGAAAALALARSGLNVALVEPHAPMELDKDNPDENLDLRAGVDDTRWGTRAEDHDARWDTRAENHDACWDTRMYAISPGSETLLSELGVWAHLHASRVQSVFRMDVRGDAGGQLRLDAYEAGTPKLATILESNHLQHALWRAVKARDNIDVFCPANVTDILWGASHSKVVLDSGQSVESELVVGADGAQSSTRERAGISASVSLYEQSGVVANFATENPHGGTAFQWFRSEETVGDIVAYLPMPGNRMSLVWSTATQHAQSLLTLEPEAFCAKVEAAGAAQLGKLRLLTPPAAFPLRLMQPSSVVARGCVLVGDAAHGVHPLAGQGVNLGFGDVAALVQVLSQRGRALCGDVNLLEHYARRRAEPVARLQFVTDSLWRLFGLEYPLASMLRNGGMSALNTLAPLKSALVHEALFS